MSVFRVNQTAKLIAIAALAATLSPLQAGKCVAQSAAGQDRRSEPYLRPLDGPPQSGGTIPISPQATPRRPAVNFDSGPDPEVERSDLPPVLASDGSGLPHELWRGVDLDRLPEQLIRLQIPPHSPALGTLWRKLLTSRSATSSGVSNRFEGLRIEALHRSGLIDEISAHFAKAHDPSKNPILNLFKARNEVAAHQDDRACESIRSVGLTGDGLPKQLRAEALMLSGYCACRKGNKAAAGLTASLVRDQGVSATLGLTALDSLADGRKRKAPPDTKVSVIDDRLLDLADIKDGIDILSRGTPALLVAIARDTNRSPVLRLATAEAAAKKFVLAPDDLAQVYREQIRPAGQYSNSSQKTFERAQAFIAAESEHTPFRKARAIRTFLDSARRAGLYLSALQMIAPATSQLRPAPEISWFTETAIEVALAADDPQLARQWAQLGDQLDIRSTGDLRHWLALIDIADSEQTTRRGEYLPSVEAMALRGRFSPNQLHRLATVLDALAYHIPIPLWEAASRTPQPSTGHLPETGVLTRLQDAAKNQEFGRTVLLVMEALGPKGPADAHMIALGDAIRALKRAGQEHTARRVGFEALFAAWPRQASG